MEQFKEFTRRNRNACWRATASSGALGIALLMAAPAIAQQTPPDASDDQATSATTNVPSTPNPASTQTPGGSTEVPTREAGEVAGQAVVGQDAVGNDIVVTGFRAAIANAITEKRNSDQIVESISAEDIGKLPDNSIAESIARLPGLTAQRVDGRDQVISIRGFAPDFSTTLLNGREQVTTNDNRAVEFDQYPAELLGQVVVYKTPSAGLIGQGISGTIDLRTIRPLEYGKRVLAGNIRGEIVTKGELNADTANKGFRASGTYIDQFANDTIGVTIGVAHSEQPSQFERYNAWGYPTFDCGGSAAYQVAGGGGCNSQYAAAQGKYVLGGAKPFVQSNNLVRTGVIGTVEWQPTNDWTTTLDALYTKFNEKQSLRGIEIPFYWGGGGEVLRPDYTVSGNSITAGTWDHVKGVVRNDYVERDAEILSGGLNSKYISGKLTFVGDASYSRVKRTDTYIETYSGVSRGVGNGPYDSVGFQTQPDGITTFTTNINYADPALIKLTSPRGWADGPRPGSVPGGQDGFFSQPKVKDELYAFRGSVSYEIDDATSLEVGGNYTSRKKSYVPTSLFLSATANINDPTHSTSVTVPSQYYLGTTSLAYLGIPGQVSFDPVGLVNDGILTKLIAANEPTAFNTWTLTENVSTGWLRFNFDQPTAAGSFSGNIGVQGVYTDQSSTGFSNFTGSVGNNDGGRKYFDLLPSMNLSMRFNDENVLRIGFARTLARARMDQLKASFNYSTNPSLASSTDPFSAFFAAGGGNPKLKPWIADGVDISLEHYFNRGAYVAAAGYYKYLENYIYDSKVLFDFTGAPTNGATPITNIGVVTQPVNGTGGVLYGGEVSGTIPLDLFAGFLNGFGVIGSYSRTESSIKANPGNPSQPLPGLSKNVASGTAYFEKAGFSARGSIRYRSGFLAEVISLGPGATNRQARGETVVDGQISYEFQNGFLKGLGLLFQGQNLTNEPFVTEDSASGLVIDSQDYGRRFLAGLAYKF